MADQQGSVSSGHRRKDFSPESSIYFTPKQSVSSHSSVDCGGELFLEHTETLDHWDMDTSIVSTHSAVPSVTSTALIHQLLVIMNFIKRPTTQSSTRMQFMRTSFAMKTDKY